MNFFSLNRMLAMLALALALVAVASALPVAPKPDEPPKQGNHVQRAVNWIRNHSENLDEFTVTLPPKAKST